MNCHKAKESISLFLDDRLGPEKQARLNRHLEDCEDCSSYLEDLRKGLAMLRAESLEKPSENFEWNLKRKIQRAVAEREVERSGARIGRREWGRFALSAAAALLVVVVGGHFWLGPHGDSAVPGTVLSETGLNLPAEGPQGRQGWIETGPSDLRPVADRIGGARLESESMPDEMHVSSPADSLPVEDKP